MSNSKKRQSACYSPLPLYEEEFPLLAKDPKQQTSRNILTEIAFKRYLTVQHEDPNQKMADLNPFEVGRKLKTVIGKKN